MAINLNIDLASFGRVLGNMKALRFLLEIDLVMRCLEAPDPQAKCDDLEREFLGARQTPEISPDEELNFAIEAGCQEEIERVFAGVRERIAKHLKQ